MKNKFYRIISPVTFLVVLVLDISVIAYAVFAVKKLLENLSVYSVIFAIIDLFAIVVGALVSKYVISQGIVFNETSFEFTALDENNIFNYDDIARTPKQALKRILMTGSHKLLLKKKTVRLQLLT